MSRSYDEPKPPENKYETLEIVLQGISFGPFSLLSVGVRRNTSCSDPSIINYYPLVA